MSNFLVIALVLSVIGVIALSITRFLNRKPLQAIGAARQQLIDQAKQLENRNVDLFFEECGIASEDRTAARSIVQFLATLLDVPPEKLAHNYEMRRLFVISQPGSGSELHPFSTEIVEGLASRSDKQRWDERWSENVDLPRDEDALVRFVMGMSLPQALKFFSPLTKRASGSGA